LKPNSDTGCQVIVRGRPVGNMREKLAVEERRAEFYRLSEETRRRMDEKRISESEILGDFEVFREGLTLD